jgi:uncharacterized BrkB/YihY/UPF0761 family membrane protein
MLWFYISGVVLLLGAEMNAEIEHASSYGKQPGEKVPGQSHVIGNAAMERGSRGGESTARSLRAPTRSRRRRNRRLAGKPQ